MEVEDKRLHDNDNTSQVLCEPCQEGNVSTQSDGYCNICEGYMCQTCFQSHLKLKLIGRNYMFGGLDQGIRKVSQNLETNCKKHTTAVIKYYCRNHDSVGCGQCLVFDHQKCEPELIVDLAKNMKESSHFKNIFKEIGDLESLKAEIEVSLEKQRNDNIEFHDKAIRGIQKYRAEINLWLDNITSKMVAEEMEIWKENEIVLSKLKDWIKIISDMMDKVRDEINTEKYTDENLFIRMIEWKSEVSEFATKSLLKIKSNLDIKYFTFEPNQNLCVLTKTANLGIIRLGNENTELQIYQPERHSDATCTDGASNIASSIFPEHEAKVVGAGDTSTLKRLEDPVLVDLEKELGQLQLRTCTEKNENEILQQSCDTLKKEFEDQESLLSRERKEREKYVLEIKELEQSIVLLKNKVSSLNDLKTNLKSQLDRRNKAFDLLESRYKARQEQDHREIKALQSELKKISEDHEKKRNSRSSQFHDRQRQRNYAVKTYELPDPRAEGFDVGSRVKHVDWRWTGTVTAVYPSGYVDVKWDNGHYYRGYAVGAEEEYHVELL